MMFLYELDLIIYFSFPFIWLSWYQKNFIIGLVSEKYPSIVV